MSQESVKYVTTAIVYPNSRIHVGWAWECLGADFLVRAEKAFGHPTFFATGMDEHSLNVQHAAENEGLEPKAYCDKMAVDIEKVLRQIGISHDRFIRTSDEDHERVVKKLIQRSFDNDDIYQAKYEGHYCESCEAYYTDKDLVDGLCPQHQKKVQWLSEENYFFRLSKYQDKLLKYYEENPKFLEPENRKNEIVNFIKAGLEDFSISRSTFTWGVPLPFQEGHVIYVWFDALINYLTAAGIESWLEDPKSPEAKEYEKRWESVTHIIGKDITRFHCIYWPAMLMSMNIPLPKRVFAHGFISLKGERMSKSSGNKVTPDEVVEVTGVDPFRYYLLAENHFDSDGNFSWESLVEKANADLANDWGNLVNRTISMTRKYFKDEALAAPSEVTVSKNLLESFEKLKAELQECVQEIDTSGYAEKCRERSRLMNLFINDMKPWVLAKDESKRDELKEVLFALLEGIRWTATAFMPLVPDSMPQVFDQLGVERPEEQGAISNLRWGEKSFAPIAPSPIYPRIELPETSE